jgi:prepilin-type N-terminal cleavage/methylation domain-containing protein
MMVRWPSARVRDERGFTLLEMLVAVTLVALMAIGLWAAFRISINSWIRGTEFIDRNQRSRSILDLVKKQIASTYGLLAPVELETGGALYPVFTGIDTSVQFISLNSLRFQDNPGLTLVSYDLVRDPQGEGYALVEREQPYLGLDPSRETAFNDQDEQVITIFDDLTSFTFEYFDPGTADRPSRWVTEWNSREMGKMPVAVSMTMVSRDSKGGLFNRHLVIPIVAKPYDPRLAFVNPFESRPRRFTDDGLAPR